MGKYTKEDGSKIKKMGKDAMNGLMVRYILGNTMMIKGMDQVKLFILLAIHTKASGSMEKNMATANLNRKNKISLEHGKKAN